MDEPEPVHTERVAASISSPLLHERDVEPPSGADADIEVAPAIEPPVVVPHPTWAIWAAVAVTIGLGVTEISGDPRVGLVLVAVAALAGLIRSADRRLSFSFGEGFVGYRADLGWPRGVQEDDHVQWSWRATSSPTRPISGR